MSRIGLLGGTFDPPHIGHVRIAEDVRRALALDEVWLIPSATPPHKLERPTTDADLRLQMVRAVLEGTDHSEGLKVSDVEMQRGGVSYTVDTLRSLTAEHPDDSFFTIMGADQFALLSTWKEPEEIARLCSVVVVARDGLAGPEVAPGTTVRGTAVEVTRVDVSSTDIRDRVARGDHVADLVGAPVARLIEEHGLYGAGNGASRT